MAGWHSLSGYLFFRPGGALGRLKARRRVWCVLDEGQCQLVYYGKEKDPQQNRASVGHIDIKRAAITLDLDNQNQFVILADGKEYIFTAENHESMMIWLLGLQAKRDTIQNSVPQSSARCTNERRRSVSVIDPPLYPWWMKPEVFMEPGTLPSNRSTQGRRSFQWEKYHRGKIAESLDMATDPQAPRTSPTSLMYDPRMSTESRHARDFQMRSKSENLSIEIPLIPCQPCAGILSRSLESPMVRQSSGDSDEVFELSREKAVLRRGEAFDGHLSQSSAVSNLAQQDRYSSISTSSDSAIDRGDTGPLELSLRLMDLEKELISAKCELAKVLNQQTSFQELLNRRDEAILELESKLAASRTKDAPKSESKISRASQASRPDRELKEVRERARVLQNQNRFLNEEVRRLAGLRQQDQSLYTDQHSKLTALEAEIEKWKLDYVSLIESSIRFPGGDSMDDAELSLYGGDRHKNRVQQLLEEARKINPSLPTYDSLASGESHVDCYGFKHTYENPGLLLHYLCRELTQHYRAEVGAYEQHLQRWISFMREHGKCVVSHLKELKPLCRGGVPDRFRQQIWRQLVHHNVKDIRKEKGPHYFRNLCNMLPESPLAACYRKQISLDLMRTMPQNIKFSTPGSKGIMDLQDVLLAFCIHNPAIGYCQGMNFIVAMALIFLDAQDAFWTLVAVTERYFPIHYFDSSLIGAQADQQVLKDILQEKLPVLFRHLETVDIEISTVTLNWFLAVFFDAVPFQTLLRIWDCFLLEGPKVLFRFAMAILKIHEKDILLYTDTIGIMRHLKSCAKLTYDVEGLLKVAFEELRPFARRHDITSKQACYLNTLKEVFKKRELSRRAFVEREHMYLAMEAEAGNFMGIECAATYTEGSHTKH